MVPAFLRTLSARILFGFAVLILTFGITTAWIVLYMEQVQVEIGVIRVGYLPLALKTKDLARKQDDLRAYVATELSSESSPKKVQDRLPRLRATRDLLLAEALKTIDVMDVPDRHRKALGESRGALESLRARLDELAPLYDKVLAAPPVDRRPGLPPIDSTQLAAATDALARLITAEGQIYYTADNLARHQAEQVNHIARNLEHNEDRLRTYTIYLGLTAIALGLMVTLWATLTLRSLRRLREAARRIAAGDYGSRIAETGPVEVADLAREFNVMGRAVDERERELVRTERLAAIGKMAAMITHEVRNPLSSIGLNTELLEEEIRDLAGADEARALCRAITREVDRLTAITEDYLAFARLPKPRLAPEQINAIAESLATFVREDLAARGVELITELDGELPRALADEAQLRQALLNLVRNATEAVAADGGGRVTIATRRSGSGRVEVEVRDDGPGISEEVLPRLFDPFFSTKAGGTGLGLALTHQIVRDHGGEIRVSSTLGHGAAFVITIPAADLAAGSSGVVGNAMPA